MSSFRSRGRMPRQPGGSWERIGASGGRTCAVRSRSSRGGVLLVMNSTPPRFWFFATLVLLISTSTLRAQVGAPPARDTALWAAIIAAEDSRADDMRSLDPLVRGVQSADPFIRRLAVRALGRFERPSLVFGITPLLSDADSSVRAEAANAMGQALYRGDASMASGSLLARLIGERDPWVRGVIAQTMGRLPYRLPEQVRTAETAVLSVASDTSPAAVYGAIRGLESLIRINVRSTPPSAAALTRLREVFRAGISGDTLGSRTRRLAFSALLAANRLDTAIAGAALRDQDWEIRRLAAGSNFVADSMSWALLGLISADPSMAVRYDALRAYGRRRQSSDGCNPVMTGLRDSSLHVVLLSLDLLGSGCARS